MQNSRKIFVIICQRLPYELLEGYLYGNSGTSRRLFEDISNKLYRLFSSRYERNGSKRGSGTATVVLVVVVVRLFWGGLYPTTYFTTDARGHLSIPCVCVLCKADTVIVISLRHRHSQLVPLNHFRLSDDVVVQKNFVFHTVSRVNPFRLIHPDTGDISS
ncbi:unnamed protein product [Brugia pahangi]|uniref:Uncharacterized protein n=1 Tax=Brugia pahangi TaxID=6280 RepID=A0A0N4T4V1_BRUPA|nr:unnamed protein product [Brugia pahangi]